MLLFFKIILHPLSLSYTKNLLHNQRESTEGIKATEMHNHMSTQGIKATEMHNPMSTHGIKAIELKII